MQIQVIHTGPEEKKFGTELQRDTYHVAMDVKSIHPGKIVLRECLESRGLSVTEAASGLGVARNTLSRLIHGRHGISADMAIRLTLAFGGTPEIWLQVQAAYDLASARAKTPERSVRNFGSTPQASRRIVRKGRLGLAPGDDLTGTIPAQRMGMMWTLASDAWVFKRGSHAESRLPRHTVHIFRGKG